ncbi:MAG: hypothetical protein IJP70_07380 [Bacteroidales bacterium]|nr:hypothetical protein [Bacteroidales bacterium]
MKQKLLLVSAVMLLMSTSAFAEWTFPTIPGQPISTALTLDESPTVYLFNVEAKGFAVGANSWGTRASVGATGDSLRLVQQGEDSGAYGIYDYLKKAYWSPDSKTGIWIDGTRTGWDGWSFIEVDEAAHIYKIAHAGLDLEATLGCSALATTTPELFLYNPTEIAEGAAFYDSWKIVSSADYKVATEQIALYYAAASLKAAIDDATAKYAGIDLSAPLAVYNNENSTKEELQDAEKSISAIIQDYVDNVLINQATVENPVEVTSKIAYADGSAITNWSRVFTGVGTTGSLSSNTWSTEGSSDGTNVLTPFIETWVAKGSTLSDQRMAHDTVRVKPGAYKITGTIRMYNESGAENISGGSLFGNLNKKTIVNDELNANKTNVSDGTEGYFTYNSMLGYYAPEATTYAIVAADSALTFGYILEDANFNWTASKNYRVYYLGEAAEAYQKVVAETELALAKVVTLADAEATGDTPTDITQSLAEDLNEAIAAYQAGADVKTAYESLIAIQPAVTENMAAWAKLRAAEADAQVVANNDDIVGEDKDNLQAYLGNDVFEAFFYLELTTEEVLKMADSIATLKTAAVENGLKPGSVYDQLVNPDFSNGATGWSGSPTVKQNCGEKYGTGAFDVYQEIENAPVGCYEIEMQGFYRKWRNDGGDSYSFYQWYDEDGKEKTPHYDPLAYVYLNDNKTPLKSIYEEQVILGTHTEETTEWDKSPIPVNVSEENPEGDVVLYANTMTTAAFAFGLDMYKVSAFGLVAKKGDKMRIGVKGDLLGGAHWAIFDNFKLIYQGKKVEIVQPELQKALAGLELGNKVVGKEVAEAVATVKTAAEAALASNDGATMFDALADIYALNASIEASVALFDSLNAKKTEIEEALGVYSGTATDEAINAASDVYGRIEAGMGEDARFTNEEARKAMAEADEAIAALKIPKGLNEASDENPVDLTDLLATPSFEKNGTNSIEGWNTTNASGYNFGNNDTQKAALALEYYQKTYNLYQDVTGLPAGTYKVGVNAFYRYTDAATDYARFAADEHGLATMYAVGTDSIPQDIRLITSDGAAEALGEGAENTFTDNDGVTFNIPNDMVSSVAYFKEGHYLNELIVKVGEDGKLRIGVQQTESVNGGWLIMDSWTLVYYGANSAKEEGPLTSIEAVEELTSAKAVELFSVSGQRLNNFQPGLNIVRTYNANGTVKVRKVYVK